MAGDNQALLLQVSADIKSLEKQFAKAQGVVDKGSRAMEKRAQEAATNLDKFFGKTDPARALDKVFDATRFKILDSGVAKVGLMGSALESLGATGLVAAAGVGAVAAAFAGAREAARFADDINDTADRLHVTTDALQEFRYAVRLAGGDEKGADEALEAFNVTLGKAQAGLPKALKAFKELGFTPAQVKGFADADTALKAVTERIAGLSSVQKDAVIDQLGLTGMKGLIEQGATEMSRLRDEAHKVGVVMDAELVKRGGELNDKFETVSKVIEVQLKSALVDVGPLLLDMLKTLAEIAKTASEVAESFKSIENRRTELLKQQRTQALMAANAPLATPGVRASRLKQVADIDAELARRAAANKPPPPPKTTRSLADQSTGPTDDTRQRTEAVDAALAGAKRDELQAQLELTASVEKRRDLQLEILEQERVRKVADLKKQQAEIDADKGISEATKKTLKAKLDQAIADETAAAAAKARAVQQQAAFDLEDIQIGVYKQQVEATIAQLEAEAAIATTADERKKIEARILALRQQLERDLQGTQNDRDLATGKITPTQHAAREAALGTTQSAERTQFDLAHENPIQQYLRSLKDLDTELQNEGVKALQGIASGVAEIVANGGKAGDVLRGLVRQLLYDFTQTNVEHLEAGLLSKFGIGQQTAGATLQASITTAGASAATAMGTAITTAGSEVAAQIAAAMAMGGGGGSLGGFNLGSLFGSGGFGFDANFGPGDIGGFDFGVGGLGGFANGTDGAPGGWTRINERGPEGLAFLPPGTKVIPNDVLRNLSRLNVASKVAPPSVSHSFSPTLHVSVMGGGMSPSDARRTGAQVGAAAMREMAKARKAGF